MIITRSKGGMGERQVDVQRYDIPDLWHVASWLKKKHPEMMQSPTVGSIPMHISDLILDCWHLCHDLLRHIEDMETAKIES